MPSSASSLAQEPEYREKPLVERESVFTYRHWFVISVLLLLNVIVFGCIFLVLMGKIRWGM